MGSFADSYTYLGWSNIVISDLLKCETQLLVYVFFCVRHLTVFWMPLKIIYNLWKKARRAIHPHQSKCLSLLIIILSNIPLNRVTNPRFGVICKKMPPEAASSFLCGCSVEWNAGEVRVRVEIWFVKVFFTMWVPETQVTTLQSNVLKKGDKLDKDLLCCQCIMFLSKEPVQTFLLTF